MGQVRAHHAGAGALDGGLVSLPSPQAIGMQAAEIAFGSPIIQNNFRALVAEVIVGNALQPEWRHCAADWLGWDFEHVAGARLEVKQSARRQTWQSPRILRPPRFDVAERTGYWRDGIQWVAERGRYAQIYVFSYHPVVDELADHRNPLQWRFHVVAASKLPVGAKTIGLPAVAKIEPDVPWTQLRDAVELTRISL